MYMTSLILMLFSLISYADSGQKELEGFDAAADVITENAVAGAFLVYDCTEEHWMCVIKENFDDCLAERTSDIALGKKKLGCAPLAEMPTKKSCFQKQLFLTGQNHGTRFCISDSWKQRELR